MCLKKKEKEFVIKQKTLTLLIPYLYYSLKPNDMRKILAILTVGLIMTTIACAHDVISRNVNDLPVQARTFIKQHFSSNEVSYIKIDKEVFKSTTYDVRLDNGMEIGFDSKGNWTEVDGDHRPIPSAFIPQQIQEAVQGTFPNERIVKIEKDNRGWEVELSNDIDLKFDKKFNIRDID